MKIIRKLCDVEELLYCCIVGGWYWFGSDDLGVESVGCCV